MGSYLKVTVVIIKLLSKFHLKKHKKGSHEVVRYNCNLCEYKSIEKGNHSRHKNHSTKKLDINVTYVIIHHLIKVILVSI